MINKLINYCVYKLLTNPHRVLVFSVILIDCWKWIESLLVIQKKQIHLFNEWRLPFEALILLSGNRYGSSVMKVFDIEFTAFVDQRFDEVVFCRGVFKLFIELLLVLEAVTADVGVGLLVGCNCYLGALHLSLSCWNNIDSREVLVKVFVLPWWLNIRISLHYPNVFVVGNYFD